MIRMINSKRICSSSFWLASFCLVISHIAYAKADDASRLSWQVQPKVCIVEKLGDSCEMALSIVTKGLEQGEYCYFNNDQLMHCKSFIHPNDTITVRFSGLTVLQLRDSQNNILLSHEMQVKARNSRSQTRRVRQPWSLF